MYLILSTIPLVLIVSIEIKPPFPENERAFEASEHSSSLSHAESNRQRRMRKATKRSLLMSIAIVIGFLVCWIPYYVCNIFLLFAFTSNEVETYEIFV